MEEDKGILMQIRKSLRPIKWQIEQSLGEIFLNYRGQGKINVIDVGAIGWLPYPWKRWKNTSKISHLLRFEPQEYASKNSNITTINAALWSEECQRDFYIYADQCGASLYQQNYAYVEENFQELKKHGSKRKADTWLKRSKLKEVKKIKCCALDNVLEGLNHSVLYHFLKIDAQGAEYEILQGAKQLLNSSCMGIQLELFEYPILKGIKLLPYVENFLNDFNFELVQKLSSGSTFSAAQDCLFIKEGNSDIIAEIKNIYELV